MTYERVNRREGSIRAARSGARRAVTSAVAAAALIVFGGASAMAQTLGEALITTAQTSPDLDVQRAALRALDEAVALARATGRPSFTGSFEASANITATERSTSIFGFTTGGVDPTFPHSFTVTATQSIYDGGQTRNGVSSAFASVESGRYTLSSVEQIVLLNAVTAYVGVVQAQENVELAEKSVTVIARQLQAAEDRFEVGEVTRTDVSQARAALAESRANLETQRGLLGQARETYIQVVGVPPGSLAPLPPLPELPSSIEEAKTIAARNHPDILAARSTVKAASAAVRQAQGALLPQIDFSASLSTSTTDPGTGVGATSGVVSVTGTIPFYLGGSLRAGVRSAQASASSARATLQQTNRAILQSVGEAWENLISSRATIRANIEQIEAERVAFDGVTEEAKVGARTTLDVLEAEEDLLEAEISLVISRATEYVNAYALLSSIGLLTIDAIDLDVERYDFLTPYEDSQRAAAGFMEDEDTDWRYNWRP